MTLSPLLLQHFQVVNLWTQDRAKTDIWSVPEFEQYLAAETGGGTAFDNFWDNVQRVTSEALHAAGLCMPPRPCMPPGLLQRRGHGQHLHQMAAMSGQQQFLYAGGLPLLHLLSPAAPARRPGGSLPCRAPTPADSSKSLR